MGVFCVDRSGATVFGTSNRLWGLLGQVLVALGAEKTDLAAPVLVDRDGYLPSWLARSWGDTLFTHLSDVVLVARPLPGREELQPVGLYRRGTPSAAAWTRAGEHLSVYDTPVATVALVFAQACTASGGFTVTTLRPPAHGGARSEVAVRRLLARSGMLRRTPGRLVAPAPPPRRRTS